MNYSISSFVYYRYKLTESIRSVAKLGYKGIEIWGGRPHAYAYDMSAKRVQDINTVLDSEGIRVPCFIPAQFRYPTNLACSDGEIRAGSIEYIKRSIDAAIALRAENISLCPGFSFYGENVSDCWNFLRDSIVEILEYASDLPMKVLLEPAHSMETDLVLTINDGLRMLRQIDNPQFGLLPDTGHLFINKEPISTTIESVLCSNFPYHVQVDDNHGSSDDHLVPGEGLMDFVDFLSVLQKNEYKGFLGIEIGWKYTCDPLPAVRKAIFNLQNIEAMLS